MPTQKNPFRTIKRDHEKNVVKRLCVAAFNNTTYRMFRKGSMDKIRKFLTQAIDREKLTRGGWKAFNERHEFLIRKFPRGVGLSSKKHRKPGFGHKAKVVDLYLRVLWSQREPLGAADARELLFRLQVPLDRKILSHVWHDFQSELKERRITKRLSLSDLTGEQYSSIQEVLAKYAKQEGVPAIWYDDLYLPDS